ncbi:putative membrane protein [Yarrowia sp. C11]|nr:putative membrane protein [Yarrowia sp. C11]KAG5370611.1 putative membrane protein [Yarrowia sp. E02]
MKLSVLVAATAALAIALPETHHRRHEGHDTEPVTVDNPPHDAGHGHDMGNVTMEPSPASMNGGHHSHGQPILAHPEKLEPQQLAYWTSYDPTNFFNTETPGQSLLTWHIVMVATAWIGVYPIAVMLSSAKSGLYLPVQTVQVALVALGAVFLGLYGSSPEVEKMYPGAIYGKFTVLLLILSMVHYLAAVLTSLAYRDTTPSESDPRQLAEAFQLQPYHRVSDSDSDHTLNGTPSATPSAPQPSKFRISEDGDDAPMSPCQYYGDDECASSSRPQPFEQKMEDKWVSRLMANSHVSSTVDRFGAAAHFVHTYLQGVLLLVAFAYVVCGVVTGSRLGMGHNVFNILAHFIKGGVFTVLGLFTFARYVGVFTDKGWAWNLNQEQVNSVKMLYSRSRANSRGSRRRARSSPPAPAKLTVLSVARAAVCKVFGVLAFLKPQSFTFEFVESALILIYGVPNIFMEHLASKDGHWTPADLQHASIAFMFIGGGLSGVLLESALVRKLLSSKTYPMSFNPFPALTIFWTGILMSQHAQALPLSTAIHTQWGYLLAIGAVFRGLTYMQYFVVYSQALARLDGGAEMNVEQLTLPSRPFTEIVASFCLISGGLVFMQSNRETVEAFVYRGIDSMFTLNVTVGVTSFIMAWELVVLAVKGWAARRK